MPTIAQNLETIKDGIDDIKENLGLSQNASLANVVTKSASVVEPTGTLQITSNDTYDVTNYASAEVNVSGGGGGDMSDYFNGSITGGATSFAGKNNGYLKVVKKIGVTINPTSANMGYAFQTAYGLIEMPEANTSSVTNMQYCFQGCTALTTPKNWNTSNVENFTYMFGGCSALLTAPTFNTSKATTLANMFNGCQAMTTMPVYNFSSATDLTNFVNGCNDLTDTAVDNILQSCISATSYIGTKKLSTLGMSGNVYTQARVEALPHYQDFVNAGWSRI